MGIVAEAGDREDSQVGSVAAAAGGALADKEEIAHTVVLEAALTEVALKGG